MKHTFADRVQIQKEGIFDLKDENQFFIKTDMGGQMIDLQREFCKPVIKLDLTAHGILEFLSEFEPSWEMRETAENTSEKNQESFVPGALTSALKMQCHLYS